MAVPSSVGDVKYRGPLGRILDSDRCHPLKNKGYIVRKGTEWTFLFKILVGVPLFYFQNAIIEEFLF